MIATLRFADRGTVQVGAQAILLQRPPVASRPAGRPPAAPTIRLVPRRLAILGSTGSIGCQALDVVSSRPTRGKGSWR